MNFYRLTSVRLISSLSWQTVVKCLLVTRLLLLLGGFLLFFILFFPVHYLVKVDPIQLTNGI